MGRSWKITAWSQRRPSWKTLSVRRRPDSSHRRRPDFSTHVPRLTARSVAKAIRANEPRAVGRVGHMAAPPLQALALLVPEQLLGPEPLGVGPHAPIAVGPVADQQPRLAAAALPDGLHVEVPAAGLLEGPAPARPAAPRPRHQLGQGVPRAVAAAQAGRPLDPADEVPAQGPAGVEHGRPGEPAVGQQRHVGAGGQAPRRPPQQPLDQPGHAMGGPVAAVAGGGDRQGPLAVGDRQLHAGQAAAVVRLVEDQQDRPPGQAVGREAGQAGEDTTRLQPGVGQGALQAAAGAGGAGPTGDGGGDAAGVAVADGGHGEAEVGQGVDLMAVQVGEEVGAEAGAPFAYVNEGTHGVGSFGSQVSHPPKPHHGCLFLPKSKKCRSVSPREKAKCARSRSL